MSSDIQRHVEYCDRCRADTPHEVSIKFQINTSPTRVTICQMCDHRSEIIYNRP